MNTIGVVGIGKMGLPMVRHLLAGGFQVFAYDLDPARTRDAAALGAVSCGSPAELARGAEVVIVVVGFDAEVMDVLTGDQGVMAAARHGAVVAIASTVYPETMQRVTELAGATGKGLQVIDIPLCRGEPAAEAGQLLLLAGGDEAAFAACKPAFACFASDMYRLGGLGAGQVGKMVNNLLLWACISANYEGLKLGEALGVDTELLREALLKSSGRNWALETWLQARPMPWAEKDMTIVLHEADRCRVSLPLCGVVKEVVKGIKLEGKLAAGRGP